MTDTRIASPTILAIFALFFAAGAGSEPADAGSWYRRAVELREAGDYAAASTALGKAEALRFPPARVALEKARIATLEGRTRAAIAHLRAIADSGFTAVRVLERDPVIAMLAGNAAYDELIESMTVQAYPCEHEGRFREFDFWIGDWEVHTADGALAGHNRITSAERGCLLLENWTSVTGGTGMSINYLDRATGEWVQTWIAEGGSQIVIRGGPTGEGMKLVGTIHYVGNGTTAPFRGLWTPLPDGRVRQYFEQSSDDGETWSPWFEGFYRRVTQAAGD
ncbi:MAG: hypothetical protein ACRES3_03710 [Steroidobacteraceae bacterium]